MPLLLLSIWIFSQVHRQYHYRLDELLYLKSQELQLQDHPLASPPAEVTPQSWHQEWLYLPLQNFSHPSLKKEALVTTPAWQNWLKVHKITILTQWGKPHLPWSATVGNTPVRCLVVAKNPQSPQGILTCLATSDEQLLATNEGWFAFVFFLSGAVGITLLLRWLNQWVIRPLNALTKACSHVADGDFSTRLPLSKGLTSVLQGVRSFNWMVNCLETNKRHEQALLASLTHDLRTPLIAEHRVLTTLVDAPETLGMYLSGLQNNNALLLRLTDDLMASCQWEMGAMAVVPQWISVDTLYQGIMGALQPLAEENSISVTCDGPSSIQVWAGPHHLERLLYNLVANAIHHCPEETRVTIAASQTSLETTITIEDNGPGLPPDILKGLQGTAAPMRRHQGIGTHLGLFICQQIMAAHQGQLKVAIAQVSLPVGTRWSAVFPAPSLLNFSKGPNPC